jgi:HEAT repeat protein
MTGPHPALDDLLLAAEDGDGPPVRHAAGCPRCARVLAEVRALDALVERPDPLPRGLLERVLDAPRGTAPRGPAWRAALAATVLGVFAFALFRVVPRSDEADPPAPLAAVREAEPSAPADPTANLETWGADALLRLHRIARDDDPRLAGRALRRLGALGRAESLPVLVEVLAREDRRREAATALGRLGDTRSIGALAPLLADPESGDAVAEAVVRIGGGLAARALGQTLDLHPEDERAASWIEALGRVDGLAGTRRLAALLRDPDRRLSAAARRTLDRHHGAVLPHVLAEATSRREASVEAALDVLEILRPEEAVPVLSGLLSSRTHRERAAGILARMDTPAAAEALVRALPQPAVRQALRQAGPVTEGRLLLHGRGASRHVRLLVIDALGLCGTRRSVPALEEMAGEAALAPGALVALGRIGGDEAVRALERLGSRRSLLRPVVRALGLTGSPAAVGVLERLVAQDRAVRDLAVESLSTLALEEAVVALVRLEAAGRLRGEGERALLSMDRGLVLAALDGMLGGDLAPSARRTLARLAPPPREGTRTVVLR